MNEILDCTLEFLNPIFKFLLKLLCLKITNRKWNAKVANRSILTNHLLNANMADHFSVPHTYT